MPDAISTQLDQLLDSFRAVLDRQLLDTDPAHEDFYAWGWALPSLTALVERSGGVLGRQVATYSDRRLLRDDDGADPDDRLSEACGYLDTMSAALTVATTAALSYHSAIGHIAVEIDTASDPAQ